MERPDIPNAYLLEEIRLNRAEIKEVKQLLGGKVSRTELYSVLTLSAAVAGVVVGLVI